MRIRAFIYMTYRCVVHANSFMLAQVFEDMKFNNGAKYSSFSALISTDTEVLMFWPKQTLAEL